MLRKYIIPAVLSLAVVAMIAGDALAQGGRGGGGGNRGGGGGGGGNRGGNWSGGGNWNRGGGNWNGGNWNGGNWGGGNWNGGNWNRGGWNNNNNNFWYGAALGYLSGSYARPGFYSRPYYGGGYGGGYYGSSYDVPYYSGDVYYSDSYYTPPVETYPEPAVTSSARVRVLLPNPDARVWFDGVLTQQTGTDRLYNTPPLDPGATNNYRVRASWIQSGQEMTQERILAVTPGAQAVVDFR